MALNPDVDKIAHKDIPDMAARWRALLDQKDVQIAAQAQQIAELGAKVDLANADLKQAIADHQDEVAALTAAVAAAAPPVGPSFTAEQGG